MAVSGRLITANTGGAHELRGPSRPVALMLRPHSVDQRGVIVVGFDGSEADAPALMRARQLRLPLLVLTTAPERAAEILTTLGGADIVLIRRVRHVSPELLFDAAATEGAVCTVLSDYSHNAASQLRPAMLAATRILRDRSARYSSLLVVRHGHDPSRPYADVLVGADSAVGSGIAALVAASVARTCGASLTVATIERRRDMAQRELFERLARSDPDFDVTKFRQSGAPRVPHLKLAREFIEREGIDASFDFRVGDPSDVLVRAARYGGHDLLVSSTMGVAARGRQGHVGQVTRRLLRLSPADHLVVFDPVTVGLVPHDETADTLTGTAEALFGARPRTAAVPRNADDSGHSLSVLDAIGATAAGVEAFVSAEAEAAATTPAPPE